MNCAACGHPRVVRKTTFIVGYGRHAGEYYICSKCWSEGENDEAWDDTIRGRILARQPRQRAEAIAKKQPRPSPVRRVEHDDGEGNKHAGRRGDCGRCQ